jgi:glutathione synthase/RimK-type ligase-like ATP-grasp enzyme
MRKIRFRRAAASAGASALSEELRNRGLNARLIRLDSSSYRQSREDLVINWGTTGLDGLNSPRAVARASNKLDTLMVISHAGLPCPDFVTEQGLVQPWFDEGSSAVCRTLLRGSGGDGIVIANTADELVPANLYTRYIKKKEEYRVHVFAGKVIDVQRKARNRDISDELVNWQVRSHENGFIFAREGVELPDAALALALDAVAALQLDFGAVDLVFNEKLNQYYVLEINSAPGLEGETVLKYADAIQQLSREV